MTWDESITRREAHLWPLRIQVGREEGERLTGRSTRREKERKCFILFFWCKMNVTAAHYASTSFLSPLLRAIHIVWLLFANIRTTIVKTQLCLFTNLAHMLLAKRSCIFHTFSHKHPDLWTAQTVTQQYPLSLHVTLAVTKHADVFIMYFLSPYCLCLRITPRRRIGVWR